MLSLVDLFSGCGGLSLGLELCGFTPVLAAELNDSARSTYTENRRDQRITVERDVRSLASLSTSDLARLTGFQNRQRPTLVAGGPPCQGFSGIGHRRTHRDVQKDEILSNHLYADMVEVISKLQPETFLFENVRGLLSARWSQIDQRFVWDEIREHFLDVLGKNYVIAYDLIHSYDYGVVQNRPRILMVGLKAERWAKTRTHLSSDLRFASVSDVNARTRANQRLGVMAGLLPRPLSRIERDAFLPNIEDLIGDLVDSRWNKESTVRKSVSGPMQTTRYPRKARNEWQTVLRARTDADAHLTLKGATLTEHEYSRHSPHVLDRFEYIRTGRVVPDFLKTKKFAQRVLPRIWGETHPQITVASLPDDYVHYEQPRSLTVREWARLQGFPDWYEFRGPRTTGGHRRAGDVRSGDSVREAPRYTQIGNAVPIVLAAAIGWHLRGILQDLQPEEKSDAAQTLLAEFLRRHLDRSNSDPEVAKLSRAP